MAQRVSGNYSASPILIDDKIYGVGEDGQVAVVAADREYQLFGKSPIGDNSFSTPAVANGRVYFRGFHSLAAAQGEVTALRGLPGEPLNPRSSPGRGARANRLFTAQVLLFRIRSNPVQQDHPLSMQRAPHEKMPGVSEAGHLAYHRDPRG